MAIVSRSTAITDLIVTQAVSAIAELLVLLCRFIGSSSSEARRGHVRRWLDGV